MGYSTESKWFRATVAFALAALSASTALSCVYITFLFVSLFFCVWFVLIIFVVWSIIVYFFKRKSRDLDSKIRELEKSLKASLNNCASERQGRIRAQQVLTTNALYKIRTLFSSHFFRYQTFNWIGLVHTYNWKHDWLLARPFTYVIL